MTTNKCSKGHSSTTADYCSECGVRIQSGAPAKAAAAPQVVGQGKDLKSCPDCGTARLSGARFCEVCRFDFQTGASFSVGSMAAAAVQKPTAAVAQSLPVPGLAPTSVSVVSAPGVVAVAAAVPGAASTGPAPSIPVSKPSTPVAGGASHRLQLRVVADPSLDKEPDPAAPCPTGQPPRVFHLDLDEMVLGRQFEGKGGHPEIVIHDPGISRRHVKFFSDPVGDFHALDLGSTNGTQYNGKALEPGVEARLEPGDELLIGNWTRITVEAR